MRKPAFIFIILLLFFIPLVVSTSSECQYKEKEMYQVEETKYYWNNEYISGNISIMEINSNKDQTTFKVLNTLSYSVKIQISYWDRSSWYGDQFEIAEGDISPNSFSFIERGHGVTGSVTDVKINVTLPLGIFYRLEMVNKTRDVCQKCKDGKICLNDGDVCKEDGQCGYNKCTIAGFCGKEDWQCPEGMLNCNNQTCLKPSTKNVGESYKCEWECLSGIGKEGVCKPNKETTFKNWIYWILGILAIIIIFVFFVKKEGLDKKLKDLEEELTEKEDSVKENNEKLERLKKEKDKLNKNHDELILKIKNAKGHVKARYEEELKRNEAEAKIRLDVVMELKEEAIRETKELEEAREKLRNERLRPRTNKQGTKVHINEEGYEVFHNTGDLFHRWWFEHKHNRKIKNRYEIHHKDFNKRNNNIDNLEELVPDEHNLRHQHRYK